MLNKFLHVDPITYETHPTAPRAELDVAVSFALAGRAFLLGETSDWPLVFERREDGGVSLEWVGRDGLPDAVGDYLELLSFAVARWAIGCARNWETPIAGVCQMTTDSEFTRLLKFRFGQYSNVLARRGIESFDHYEQIVLQMIGLDFEDATSQDGTYQVVKRIAGLFLIHDHIADVTDRVKSVAHRLSERYYIWEPRTRAGEYAKLCGIDMP